MKRDRIRHVLLTVFFLLVFTLPFVNADDIEESGLVTESFSEADNSTDEARSAVRESVPVTVNETPTMVPYTYIPPPAESGRKSSTAEKTASESYVYAGQWGTYGSGPGQFKYPAGIYVDPDGYVYVADHRNARVQKFDSNGTYLDQFGGTYGSGPGQMQHPWGVAEDLSGNIYITDAGNNCRVQKYDADGTYITQWGSLGTGLGQFYFPTGVATDSSGDVYVAGFYNQRIQVFTNTGTLLSYWGSYGTGDGQFNHLHDVEIDASDNVYIVDYDNQRIQKFTSDGTFITKWGSYGSGDGQFNNVRGIGLDPSGNVYIADTENHRIQKFTSNGTFITKWGSYGSGDGQMSRPHGVGEDANGNVYVTDFDNHRILKFRLAAPVADFTATPTSGYRPLTVQFTDNSTGSPTSWEWDFGDNSDLSNAQNPLHIYKEMGTYAVNLTVSNSQGSDSEMKTGYIAITGGTYSVFVEGIENYHGTQPPLVSSIDIASTFYDNIDGTNNGAIWTGYNEFYDDDTGSKHWSYSESSEIKADDADFALFAGHGANNRIAFGTNNSYLDLYRTDMKFGDSKLKWVSLFACHVLDDETRNEWESVFDGLHILNGFETEGLLDDTQGGVYAAYLKGGIYGGDYYDLLNIRSAWRATLEDTIGNSSYYGAWMWAEPCGEDYLPGYGDFCHAPVKENGDYNISYRKFDCDPATGD